jgi:hypothetical protein
MGVSGMSAHALLHKLIDDFSYQVYSDSDRRFWFRLVREPDCDIITDYLLGSFPRSDGAALLIQCYRTLGLTPARNLKFLDIVPEGGGASDSTDDAQRLYAEVGSALLTHSGASSVNIEVEESLGRMNLLVNSERCF